MKAAFVSDVDDSRATLDPGGVRPDHNDALWKGCRRTVGFRRSPGSHEPSDQRRHEDWPRSRRLMCPD